MQVITRAQARRLLTPVGQPLLCGITVESLRGFRRTTLDIRRDLVVLVGPNNSGKTSLLRLLDWIINVADDDLLRGRRVLTPSETALLIPARNTRGGARRMTLNIELRDGRRHTRFFADHGVARLRIRVRDNRLFANVRPPTRSEPLTHEEDAIALLNELRSTTVFKYVPASRDATSTRFQETFLAAVEAKLGERALHQHQAVGAPGEYREIKRTLDSLKALGDSLVAPLWTQMQAELMPGMTKAGSLTLDLDPESLVRWMAERMSLRLVTGEHDPKAVIPMEVGSGLQSLLDLAVLKGEVAAGANVEQILAVEEPEAFLHPSAQRLLARRLMADDDVRRIIATHSPAFVDEARYGDVVLVKNHEIFPPTTMSTSQAEAINSALLTGQGSEMLFSGAVLLVEGEGDRQFFETLRRRVAASDESGVVESLAVVWVGSKTSFAPWMRLVESYTSDGRRPIEWLGVADGADAATDVRAALRDANIRVAANLEAQLETIKGLQQQGDEPGSIKATSEFNRLCGAAGLRVHLLPVDLEWCAYRARARRHSISFRAASGCRLKLAKRCCGSLARSMAKARWQSP